MFQQSIKYLDFCRMLAGPLVFLWLAHPLHAMEWRGQVRAGAYTRTVTLPELDGETNNDEYILSGLLRFEASELNDSGDLLLFELRDKIDNFGKLDRENLQLSSYNRMQLRVAAYQRPWESNKTYYTLGRFSLPEANLLVHDGVEFGHRFSKNTRFGVYAGRGPQDILTPLYVDPVTTKVAELQAGAYLTYDRKEGPEDSSYLTQGVGKAPSFDITDATDHVSYFQQGLWTFTSAHRLASLVLFDLQPASKLRRGSLSYTYLSEDYRSIFSFQQTDMEDYFLKQTLQDTLLPSAVQSINLELRQRLSDQLSFDYSARYGRRSQDSLTQDEIGLGVLKQELISKSDSIKAQFALRRNFISRDRVIRVGYDYWSRGMSLGLSHVMTQETYDDGETNSRQDTSVDAGFYLSDRLRGSLGVQRESDSLASANALFFMIAYRFGGGSSSPVRLKPADFESI